ncbi:MAG: SIS domain-containing protein [Rubrivivax sp.]|nr:SIS domain-containing protein [Rubrivivax sp.]
MKPDDHLNGGPATAGRGLAPGDGRASGADQPPSRSAVPLPLDALFESNLLQHRRLFAVLDGLRPAVGQAAVLMADCLHRGGRLYFMGNGGSASDSLHLAAEFNGRLKRERAPLPATALCADGATLTAIANDYGFDEVFARQLQAHARPGDCVVALSTSGRSPNVLRGLAMAGSLGVASVALLGQDGGGARVLADRAIVVPHDDTARIQEAHIFIGHTLCGQVERALGLVV